MFDKTVEILKEYLDNSGQAVTMDSALVDDLGRDFRVEPQGAAAAARHVRRRRLRGVPQGRR